MGKSASSWFVTQAGIVNTLMLSLLERCKISYNSQTMAYQKKLKMKINNKNLHLYKSTKFFSKLQRPLYHNKSEKCVL
jgi:hypothetical protein